MTNTGSMMKAALLQGASKITIESIPRPKLAEGEILLRVRACGICGSDLHTFEQGLFEEMGIPVNGGRVLGHEFAGEVAEIKGEVSGLKVGDRVCTTAIGGNSEYVKIPASSLPIVFPIREGISFEEAATVEPLATSLHAVNLAAPQEGETHVIIGAGIIGLGILQVLTARRANVKTIVCDISETRLALATEFGATLTINAVQENTVETIIGITGSEHVMFLPEDAGLVDTVYDCAGLSAKFYGIPALQQALVVTKPGGNVIALGLFEKLAAVDHNLLVLKGINLRGSIAWSPEEFHLAMDLLNSEEIDRKPLISHRFPLEETQQAYETQLRVREAIKVMINP